MSDQRTSIRRPFALGAALLVAVAALLMGASGQAGAGRPLTFTLDPASAEVGATITATSDVECPPSVSGSEVHLAVFDAADVELFSGTIDIGDAPSGDWTTDIVTAGLEPGTYTVEAQCVRSEFSFNYQTETFTLTAATTTTTTTSTTSPTSTTSTTAPTSETSDPTAPASTPDQPAAAPADAVAGAPDYTG